MKKNLTLVLIVVFIFLSLTVVFANKLIKTTANYENDYYTFTFDNDLKTLSYSLRGYYVYAPNMLIGTSVTKYWTAAGPGGAVVVYRIESNTFPYVMINYRTGQVEQTGYLLIPDYEVSDAKIVPTKDGAKVTVYFEKGGDKTFDLQFKEGTIHI